jgi:hypothetical protein
VAYLRRDPGDEVTPPGMVDPQFYKRDNDTVESFEAAESVLGNADGTAAHMLEKRELKAKVDRYWHLSQLSTPANVEFDVDDKTLGHMPSQGRYYRQYEDSAGGGQTIYIVEPGHAPGAQVCIFLFSHVLGRSKLFLTWRL